MPPTPPSDAELIRRAAAGERDAFAQLYQRHQRAVFRFAHAMSGSAAVADDVTQDVFVLLMRDVVRYDPTRAALSTFLCAIARNVTRRRLRSERRFTVMMDDTDGSTLPVAADDPSAPLDHQREVAIVRRCIASLGSRYREAVILCDLQELSYAEAADVLDVPIGTVRSRLHRGRQLLSERLALASARVSHRGGTAARCTA